MWCSVGFVLYFSVTVRAYSGNPEWGNFSNFIKEQRFDNHSHPPSYTFPTPPTFTPPPRPPFPPIDGFDPFLPNGELKPLPSVNGPNITTGYDEDKDEDPCNPHFSEKPDFLIGRRISEAKCMDYIWNLKRMQEIEDKRFRCEIETKRKETVSTPAIPAAVGGRAAFPGEFPHMGAVGWRGVNDEWLFRCGSSLISPKFVLTAAHCSKVSSLSTDIADPVPKIVRLSHVNIDLATRREEHRQYDTYIERIIVHPNYKPPKKYYDIALMELDKEVGFTQMVQPACLWTSPETNQLRAVKASLTGWGVLKEGSLDISPILQAAIVDVIGKHQCDSLLSNKRNRNWSGLQDHQICAGKLAGGVDACQGDSGGPLQMQIKLDIHSSYKLYYVIGITAFGFGCARRNLPGVYTRVSSFVDWIEPIVWK